MRKGTKSYFLVKEIIAKMEFFFYWVWKDHILVVNHAISYI